MLWSSRKNDGVEEKRKGGKRPILLIERLELASLPIWAWLAWHHKGGYYVGWAKTLQAAWLRRFVTRLTGLRQLRYEEFPGTYFEVQRITATSANDALYEGAREIEAAPVIGFLRRFRNNELIEVALRRALQDVYTLGRVKTLVLFRELARTYSEVILFPRDNRDMRPWAPISLSEPWANAVIPRIVHLANTVKGWLEPVVIAGYVTLLMGYLIAQRGVAWSSPSARRWRVAFDTLDEGIYWHKPYHSFFLYDDNALPAQTILHVVRSCLKDERSRRHFEDHRIPFVEAARIPIPLRYLFQSVLRKFWCGSLRLILSQPHLQGRSPFIWGAIVVTLNLMKAELLENGYRSDVFIGRDEYSVGHIVRTMIYDERGGKTIGFSHGDDPCPTVANSYQCCHVFCFPGQFHKDTLSWNTRYSRNTCVIGAGLYGLDMTHRRIATGLLPARYLEIHRDYRIVGAFASSFQEDFFITREMTLRFYRTVLRIPKLYPDVVLVLRPKGNEFSEPEFRSLLLDAGPRVILEEEIWTYDLIPAFDLMICIAVSSVGLEGLMAGRRVIYFDESNFDDHPYAQYDPMLVARSPERLLETVSGVLERGEYIEPSVLEQIRRYHGFRFDGKVVQRLREVIYAAMDKTAPTAEPSDSLSLLPIDTCQTITEFTEQGS